MSTNIRKLLLAGASLTALGMMASTPVLAADIPEPMAERTISGTFEKYFSYAALDGSEIDNSSNEADNFGLAGGSARVDVPFGDNWSIQGDIDAEVAFFNDSQTEDDPSSMTDTYSGNAMFGTHVSFRDVDRYLFGIFGGGGKAFIDEASDGISPNVYFLGAEAQFYLANTTFYAQGGYFDTDADTNTGDFIEDAWFARGVVRHFFGENTMLQAEGSYANGDETDSNSDEIQIIGWGARLEHQFRNWGDDGYMSLFVEYRGSHFDNDSGTDQVFTEHAGLIGVKFALNQGTLLSNDRTGATLDLPRLGWWVGESPAAD